MFLLDFQMLILVLSLWSLLEEELALVLKTQANNNLQPRVPKVNQQVLPRILKECKLLPQEESLGFHQAEGPRSPSDDKIKIL
jgi:hypothetical protein